MCLRVHARCVLAVLVLASWQPCMNVVRFCVCDLLSHACVQSCKLVHTCLLCFFCMQLFDTLPHALVVRSSCTRSRVRIEVQVLFPPTPPTFIHQLQQRTFDPYYSFCPTTPNHNHRHPTPTPATLICEPSKPEPQTLTLNLIHAYATHSAGRLRLGLLMKMPPYVPRHCRIFTLNSAVSQLRNRLGAQVGGGDGSGVLLRSRC